MCLIVPCKTASCPVCRSRLNSHKNTENCAPARHQRQEHLSNTQQLLPAIPADSSGEQNKKMVESRVARGVSPPRSRRTVRDSPSSSGSYCSACGLQPICQCASNTGCRTAIAIQPLRFSGFMELKPTIFPHCPPNQNMVEYSEDEFQC